MDFTNSPDITRAMNSEVINGNWKHLEASGKYSKKSDSSFASFPDKLCSFANSIHDGKELWELQTPGTSNLHEHHQSTDFNMPGTLIYHSSYERFVRPETSSLNFKTYSNLDSLPRPYVNENFVYYEDPRLGGSYNAQRDYSTYNSRSLPQYIPSSKSIKTKEGNVPQSTRVMESNQYADNPFFTNLPNPSSVIIKKEPDISLNQPKKPPVPKQCLLELLIGPEQHQVKDWFITPTNALKINIEPSSSDVIAVYLRCEESMGLSDPEIFLGAVSPKFNLVGKDCVYIHNLKISKEMVQGPTKGYKFCLMYTLLSRGKEVYRLNSNPFHLYSRSGFPSHLKRSTQKGPP